MTEQLGVKEMLFEIAQDEARMVDVDMRLKKELKDRD